MIINQLWVIFILLTTTCLTVLGLDAGFHDLIFDIWLKSTMTFLGWNWSETKINKKRRQSARMQRWKEKRSLSTMVAPILAVRVKTAIPLLQRNQQRMSPERLLGGPSSLFFFDWFPSSAHNLLFALSTHRHWEQTFNSNCYWPLYSSSVAKVSG